MRNAKRSLIVICVLFLVGGSIFGLFALSQRTKSNVDVPATVQISGEKVVISPVEFHDSRTGELLQAPGITIDRKEIAQARANMKDAGLSKYVGRLSDQEIARIIQKANVTSLDVSTQYKNDKNLKR
ncbi:MAG: hypothetical protein LBM27_03770 [Lactobacillaceae bacterium]|jgi:hypothetical protein|nr:hypothetical protein [Lactobacillaceae bacterium]